MTPELKEQLARSLHLLWQKNTWWSGPTTQEKLQALEVIAAWGRPGDIPLIFQHILNRRTEIAVAAAAAIGSIMARVPPNEWLHLYDGLRYMRLAPTDLKPLLRLESPQVIHALGVATLNQSGYVRQAALEALRNRQDRAAVPYLLLRLADWVPPVRDLAADLMGQYLTAEYVRVFLQNRRLLDWLATVRRVDLSEVRNRIFAYLRSDVARGGVIAALDEPESRLRLFCYELLESELEAQPELVIRAARDPAVEVRAWIAARLPRVTGQERDALLTRLIVDRSARVRASAMRAVNEDSREEVQDQVASLLYDRSLAVRREARRLLSRHRELDFAALYRKEMVRGEITPGVVAGLGEVGTAEDAPLIEPFVHHSRPATRAAALAALARVAADVARHHAFSLLAEPSGRVRREAVAILIRGRRADDLPQLRRLLQNGTGKTRQVALRIIAVRGGWEALAEILYSVLQDDPDLVQQAWQWLRRWHGESVTLWQKLSPETLQQIREHLSTIRERGLEVGYWSAYEWQNLEFIVNQAERLS